MEMARRQGKKVALMFLDLDNFKNINDSFGHEVGDRLLLEVSKRLQECIRHSDTVSRQGGDEFLVLLPVVEALEDPSLIAKKLIEAMVKPFIVEDHQIKVTLSIGISLFPSDGANVESILRNADTAMYQAKEQGRNSYRVFTADMDVRPKSQQSADGDTGQDAIPLPRSLPIRNQPKPDQQESGPDILTLAERENDVLFNERSADLREEAADLREAATALLGKALQSQEKAADLRQDSADLREIAVTQREKTLRPKEEAARAQSELSASTHAQLQEANEHLVLATVEANMLRETAEEATDQVSKMAI
jgi:diguanylate cyclase (GGDEF)-like protein